jgi:hypothetical protein
MAGKLVFKFQGTKRDGLGPGDGWGDDELKPRVLVAGDATSVAHCGEGRTAAVPRTPASARR